MSTQVSKLFGPPGTGKTTALLEIMEREIQGGVHPSRIAFLSFTRKARQEAVERAGAKFNLTWEDLPYFRTLHAIAFRSLSVERGTMLSSPRQMKEFGELMGVEFTTRAIISELGLEPTAGGTEGDRLQAFDNWRRNRMMTPQEAYRLWDDDLPRHTLERYARGYQEWKRKEDLTDFTDLLERVTDPLPCDVVFVDEAQDLSTLQWSALNRITQNARRVYVAGDDDQSIYEWSGAHPELFINLPAQETRVLDQSYRLPRRVWKAAQEVVERIEVRQEKTWRPRDDEGRLEFLMSEDQINIPTEGDTMILVRNHYLGKRVEDQLRADGVPYGNRSRDTPAGEWGAAILLWERLRAEKTKVTPSQAQVLVDAMVSGKQVTRGAKARIGRLESGTELTLSDLRDRVGVLVDGPWFDALGKIDREEVQYLRAVMRKHGPRTIMEKPPVILSTIHGSKGGQADHVFLLTEVSKKVEQTMWERPDTERRVFYVGITRARHSLTLVGPGNPVLAGLT